MHMNINILCDGKDIYRYVESITWSGDIQQCYRTLAVKLRNGVRPECGDSVKFYEGGKLLFAGYVQEVSQDPYSASFEAADVGVYLSRNDMYREYTGTPQAITRDVCKEIGLKVGKLATTKTKKKVTSTGSMSAAKVIEQAYEGKRRRARQYSYYIKLGKLYIERVGTVYAGRISTAIETISRSWSVKNMVNRVVVLTDKNKKSGSVENKADRKRYGTYQKTYKHVKGKSDSKEARELLARLSKTASITAVGKTAMVAGRRIKVCDKWTGLAAEQIIKSDRHTWGAEGHEMTLEMYYAEK